MNKTWWKESVIYQIYPRSFKDTNNDGVGDLPGVIEKLDYIASLGVDVIWLCPVYQSPNDDNGYDVSDYQSIHPDFGTMADFDALLEGIHARGMRLVMDLVANHTSDEHKWFREAKADPSSPKRDYYIWKDGVDQAPPNNWPSFFGGDAWTFDQDSNQYYLRLFTQKQPDLNWDNPQVRREVHNIMKFWLDKGIDGFRMDVISVISKRGFSDTPYEDFNLTISEIYANGPNIHSYLQEMHHEVMSKYDMMTVGEGPGISLENGLEYVGEDRQELNMVFHFDHMFIDHGPKGKFDPIPYDFVRFKKIFADWDAKLGDRGWNSIFLGNHDFPRLVSRFANDQDYHAESAKLMALMLLTMRGTPYIYQGDEIGMTNVAFDSFDDYRDVETLNLRDEQYFAERQAQLLRAVHTQGRDNARTPMQWSSAQNAGFSEATPWIKTNPNYPTINIEQQESDPSSILNFYRKMIVLRKTYPALVYGSFQVLDIENAHIFAYYRQDEEYKLLILLNFSSDERTFELDQLYNNDDLIRIVSNYRATGQIKEAGKVELKPWESILFKVKMNKS